MVAIPKSLFLNLFSFSGRRPVAISVATLLYTSIPLKIMVLLMGHYDEMLYLPKHLKHLMSLL